MRTKPLSASYPTKPILTDWSDLPETCIFVNNSNSYGILTVRTVRRNVVSPKRGEARQKILECAEALVREKGADAMSIDAVAAAAGSAKGLVHYHFKTKQGLLSAVARRLAEFRTDRWKSAFAAPSAHDAVQQTWTLLTEESGDGTLRAWHTLFGTSDRLTDESVKHLHSEFAASLCTAFSRLLRDELGLTPTIPEVEIGILLETIIDGIGVQLTAGTDGGLLESVYAAAWLGVLSLTQPIS